MADVQREARIKISVDTGDADRALPNLIGSFTEVNSAMELLSKAWSGGQTAFRALVSTVERGQALNELGTAFKNLYGATSTFANDGLGSLREALQGTVADVDIMRAANQAALEGLDPEAFKKVAEAAEALGDAAGKDAKTALEELSQGLATGREKLLAQYVGLIDNTKAEQKFAESIGTTADKLSEAGKKEALRVEVLSRLSEKAKSAGEAEKTAGDYLERAASQAQNFGDKLANLVNNSGAVRSFFQAISEGAEAANKGLDLLTGQGPWGKAFDAIGRLNESQNWFNYAKQFGTLFEGSGDAAQNAEKGANAVRDLVAAAFEGSGIVEKFGKALGVSGQQTKDTTGWIKDQTDERKKLNDEIEKQRQGLNKLDAEMREGGLEKALTQSIEKFDAGGFNSLLGGYREAVYNNTLEGLRQTFKDLPQDELAQRATILTDEKIGEMTKALEDKSIEAFQNSVGVFQDLFQNAIDGTTFNLADALKRVAVGFAAQMAAGIASSLGINVSGVSGAGGIGQAIASSVSSALGLPTGGQAGIGSIFSGLFGGGGNIGPIADGGQYGAMIGGGPLANFASMGIGPQAGILAGAAATGYAGYNFFDSVRNGNKPSLLSQALLAPLTGGLSFAGSLFGSSGDPDRLARDDFFSKLEDKIGSLSFAGIRGQQTIDPGKFNVDFSNPLKGQSVGLVNPIAQILGGGKGKLSEDIAGIFTNALGEVTNFNEAVINTQSLLDALGMNAEDAKKDLTNLFLDGKVSADDFTAGIANLNVVAQDNLVGKGSVADAINILNDKLSTPRAKIKAIGLAFGEMAELGIDSTEEIHAYLTDKFGPQVAALFDNLAAQGIDSFQEIKDATPDIVATIANLFKELGFDISDSLSDGSSDGVKKITKNLRLGEDAVDRFKKKIREVGTEFKKLADVTSTTRLNTNPA